jgi:putative NADH-flavin reductase
MNIVIFGASGPTGKLLVREAVAAGHTVTAVMRDPQPIAGVTLVHADVLASAAVSAAVAGADAVLSALGVPFGRKRIDTYSRGTANIVAAMQEHGVKRLIVTSSSAADPSVRFKNSGGGALLEALKPLVIYGFGRTTYVDMRRMERLVRESGLDWTIVRPSGLFNTDVASDYAVEQDHVRGAFTSRLDLARFMVGALDSDEWVGRHAAVATRQGAPKVLEFFRSEALK